MFFIVLDLRLTRSEYSGTPFLCLEVKLLVAFFKTISTFMEVHRQIVVGHGSIEKQEK